MGAKRAGVWLLWALPLALVVGLAWYQLAGVGPYQDGEVVAFRDEGYRRTALWTALVLWTTLAGVLVLMRGARWRRHRWYLTGLLVAVPLLETFALGDMVFSWNEVCSLEAPGGTVYRVRRSLPGYLLTADVRRGLLLRQERIIGFGDNEFPALLIRPEAGPSAHIGARPTLVESADGRWLAVLMAVSPDEANEVASCQSHVVYDRRTGRIHGAADLPEVSPFILVGPRDHLDRSDVRAFLARPGRVHPVGLTLTTPSAATVVRDLRHANPEVREVAADKLDMMNRENSDLEAAADALRQVASSSTDPVAQEAARRALGRLRAAQQEGR